MTSIHKTSKPIAEGYLAGAAALIVSLLWMAYAPIHPVIIFALFLIGLFCLSLTTLWLFSKGQSIKEWLLGKPVRYLATGLIEGLLIVAFASALLVFK